MSVNLSPVGGVAAQFFGNNGAPLSGGKLYTYDAGTTTPQVTYTTSAGNIKYAADVGHDDCVMTIVNATSIFNKKWRSEFFQNAAKKEGDRAVSC